jgi:hypothetical protein
VQFLAPLNVGLPSVFLLNFRVSKYSSFTFPLYIKNIFLACSSCLIILLVVLYGCETWSLTLREKRRLRVFENRVLRKVFGPNRDEVTREWRKLHNEGLTNLYSSPNIMRVVKSRRMRWAGRVARMGEGGGVHRVLMEETRGKETIGKT